MDRSVAKIFFSILIPIYEVERRRVLHFLQAPICSSDQVRFFNVEIHAKRKVPAYHGYPRSSEAYRRWIHKAFKSFKKHNFTFNKANHLSCGTPCHNHNVRTGLLGVTPLRCRKYSDIGICPYILYACFPVYLNHRLFW